MPVVYADASALTKLIVEEPESEAFRAFADEIELMSSEVVVTEVPRALRRIASEDSTMDLDRFLWQTQDLLDLVTTAPIEEILLEAAGELPEPGLRSLDAIHVVTALYLQPIDAFATYDRRQAASARLAGLRTVAPGT